jgi:hypothetical protein
MKVSCDEGVASHVGPELCGHAREGMVEALTGESASRVLSLENLIVRSADGLPGVNDGLPGVNASLLTDWSDCQK